jgi:hypothetical protein
METCNSGNWLASLGRCHRSGTTMPMQQYPMSVGARLLEAGHMDLLWAAEDYDLLRLGCVAFSRRDSDTRTRCCALCHQPGVSMPHILAECAALAQLRESFLARVDPDWSIKLRFALWGDWPATVLNPHVSLSRLIESVKYVASVVQSLRSV